MSSGTDNFTTSTKETVFISYARINRAFVERLTADLQAAGVKVWVDTQGLEAGTPDWDQALRDAIGASKAVLFLASPESRRSPYVAGELLVADACECPVIPVWVSGEKWINCVPLSLSRTQHIDCRDEHYRYGFAELVKKLTGVAPIAVNQFQSEEPTVETTHIVPDTVALKNRHKILERVKKFWIIDVLERSLHHATMLQLGKEDRAHLVTWTTTFRTHRGAESNYVLPPETTITDIFDRQGCTLLITGEPGSGKTTTLLEFARDMIARAEKDLASPIPVVFNLSSWSGAKQTIVDWLVSELNSKYQVSKSIAQQWIENEELLLLLDGLDEVKVEKRDDCVDAINIFRQDHDETQIAVCCRISDYEALRSKLKLESAIYLQPLKPEQINQYLEALGPEMEHVRAAILNDPDLMKLAQVPLMLNIMLIAYQGENFENMSEFDSVDAHRNHLFKLYVEQMLNQKVSEAGYEKATVIRWLSWLASKMVQQGQSVFLIENLQPTYLDTELQHGIHRVVTRAAVIICAVMGILLLIAATGKVSSVGFIIGITVGLLMSVINIIGRRTVAASGSESASKNFLRREINRVADRFEIDLPGELTAVVPGALLAATTGAIYAVFSTANAGQGADSFFLNTVNYWATSGLVAGVICLVTASFVAPDRSIKTYETLTWSMRKAGRFLTGAYSLTIVVICSSFLIALGIIPTAGWKFGVAAGIGVLVLFVYLFAILSGLISKEMETKAVPNQGIWNSLRNGVRIGLVTGISFFLVLSVLGFSAGVPEKAVSCGLVMFLISGLAFAGGYGAYTYVQHVNLRHILYTSGNMPFNYAKFLNFAVEHILMQRVGGGYIFIHRLLLEYFASLNSAN
jgi:eukaryotic-like serine/threonine-protein kinase